MMAQNAFIDNSFDQQVDVYFCHKLISNLPTTLEYFSEYLNLEVK